MLWLCFVTAVTHAVGFPLIHIAVDKFTVFFYLCGKVVIPMIFLSMLLRQSVYDIEGRRLGALRDIYVSLNETFPVVTALVVATSTLSNSDTIVPCSQVDTVEELPLHLTLKQSRVASYTPQPDELLLNRHLPSNHIF